MVRKLAPLLLGLLVTLGTAVLLSEVVPTFTAFLGMSFDPVLALQIQSALQFSIAVFAGAVVARGNFLGPALALAVLGWGAVVYIAYDISQMGSEPNLVEFMVRNLTGLLLYLAAATVGALFGGRYYSHRRGDHDAAT